MTRKLKTLMVGLSLFLLAIGLSACSSKPAAYNPHKKNWDHRLTTQLQELMLELERWGPHKRP